MVLYNVSMSGGGSKDALDMRTMEMERRLRVGEELSESWREPGGFEKYTKVGCVLHRHAGNVQSNRMFHGFWHDLYQHTLTFFIPHLSDIIMGPREKGKFSLHIYM